MSQPKTALWIRVSTRPEGYTWEMLHLDGHGLLVVAESSHPFPNLAEAASDLTNDLLRRLAPHGFERMPTDVFFRA